MTRNTTRPAAVLQAKLAVWQAVHAEKQARLFDRFEAKHGYRPGTDAVEGPSS